jgi:hypothetical protein
MAFDSPYNRGWGCVGRRAALCTSPGGCVDETSRLTEGNPRSATQKQHGLPCLLPRGRNVRSTGERTEKLLRFPDPPLLQLRLRGSGICQSTCIAHRVSPPPCLETLFPPFASRLSNTTALWHATIQRLFGTVVNRAGLIHRPPVWPAPGL